MRKTRKIISTLLAIVTAFSVFAIAVGTMFSLTLINQEYLTNHFITDEVVSECENQLTLRYSALEKKSNIPSKVFEKVMTDMPVKSTMTLAIDNFYNGHDSTMYSVDKADYFYEICTEYLQANNIEYNKQDVENTAQEAAQIYSECVGFHNIDYVRTHIAQLNSIIKRVVSISVVFTGVCAILMFVLHGYKIDGVKYIGSAFFAAGFGGILTSIICLISGMGTQLNVSPAIYQQGLAHCVMLFFVFFALVSLAIFVVGGVAIRIAIRAKIVAKQRKNVRFFKRIDIINMK